LLHPDATWHGGDRSAAGACHNSSDVLAFLHQAVARGGVGELVDVIDAGDQVVIVLRPLTPEGSPVLRANLASFRDGMVSEMVAYASPEAALDACHRARTRRG
jgi:hypothetical protein